MKAMREHTPQALPQEQEALSLSLPIGGQLLSALRERIVSGELVPGTRLSEQDIANHYGLSRQPVRETFIRLAGEGLVEVRPQRGTFVRKIFTQEVEVSRFVREAVEVEILRVAVERIDAPQIAALRDQVARQARVSDAGPPLAFMELDELFHRSLAAAADRAGAWTHLHVIKMHMDRVRYLTAAEFPVSRLVGEHREIVEALAARDPEEACAAVRRHLRGVLEDLPLIVAAQPDYFETGPARSGPPSSQQRGRIS